VPKCAATKIHLSGLRVNQDLGCRGNQMQHRELEFNLRSRASPQKIDVPPLLGELLRDRHFLTVHWKAS